MSMRVSITKGVDPPEFSSRLYDYSKKMGTNRRGSSNAVRVPRYERHYRSDSATASTGIGPVICSGQTLAAQPDRKIGHLIKAMSSLAGVGGMDEISASQHDPSESGGRVPVVDYRDSLRKMRPHL
jgi:hypothetical protein